MAFFQQTDMLPASLRLQRTGSNVPNLIVRWEMCRRVRIFNFAERICESFTTFTTFLQLSGWFKHKIHLSNKITTAIMFKQIIASLFFAAVAAKVKKGDKKGKSMKKNPSDEMEDITLYITNLSVGQPFAPFFVMTHNDMVPPLYKFGDPSSAALAMLAENGNPGDLINMYSGLDGVGKVFSFKEDAPYFGGESLAIEVPVSEDYPYVTIAAMAIHTNDCFVAINGMMLKKGDTLFLPGLDSGSEENNESCDSIPGPACPSDPANIASGNGEGFVHVHRGFFGIGDLLQELYDWRNPMAQVKVM
jgi:hypothetical protein